MSGADVKLSNLQKLIAESNASEYHSSARIAASNPLTYINTNVSDYGKVYVADEDDVRAMVGILNRF
ncbi:hypothetical protein [Mucilaginibacter dorajii]|uniref:Uncharacterized protein n=1 Tax=Mucilaginibacter dorajii TaxID=692994 RepID=A0ABP7Q2Y1_9SPHI|nr:hypothetical protein [Mucilaginibacter dorajii]MCS3732735.1 copper homeostasis protein CutC [Mucilaginibacter dorajii]